MKIKSFQGGYDKNFSYIIWCEKTKHAALVDASTALNPIKEYIEEHNLIFSKIFITHSHYDHIAYLDDFLSYYSNLIVYCYHEPINLKKNYRGLIDSESIILGDELLIALYTPGHFIDSMSFWDKKNNSIFTGDTIFVGRPGRTVSNTSNIKDLYESIYNKILQLPGNTMIYPGHNYGFKQNITIKENIELFDFFSCNNFEKFHQIMDNFEKNR